METAERERAIELIGTNIETYGHFESFMIPYENGSAVDSEGDVTEEEFLKLVYDYYYTDRLNDSYCDGTRDGIQEAKAVKRFVKKRAPRYDLGKEWLDNQKFKK